MRIRTSPGAQGGESLPGLLVRRYDEFNPMSNGEDS
jgi:hypothetical protein